MRADVVARGANLLRPARDTARRPSRARRTWRATPARSRSSSSSRVVCYDARRQAIPVIARERPPTPQMWNHSSTSTVNAFGRGRGASRTRRRRHADFLAAVDEVGDRVHRAQHPRAGLLVADRHAEGALDLEHELEHVDRVEAEALAEERRAVADLFRRHRQPQAADDGLLDLCPSRPADEFSHRLQCHSRPPSTPMTWPVM